MSIPLGQRGHSSQVGPFEKLQFLVVFVVVSLTTNIMPKVNYKFVGPQKGPTPHQHGIQCLHIVLGKTQHVSSIYLHP
jgi:hypothetical protein